MSDAELISIASGDLTARINPDGAELWSLTDGQGREYMTDADPAFWTGHAPLLFPIVGSLNGDACRVKGRTFELSRHGFARHSHFELADSDAASACFRLTDSAGTRTFYPFAFVLEMAFRLEGWTLHMEASVSNPGDEPLPFSFGYHPAFAWPLPGGAAKEAHRIAFEKDEPQPIRRLDGPTGLVLPDPQHTPVEGNVLVPDAEQFEADAMIWDSLSSRSLTFGAPGGSSLAIAFPDTPLLGIWQKPGAHYICIEPWQGIADPMGFTGDFEEKPGIVLLEPGAKRSFRMDVTVQPG